MKKKIIIGAFAALSLLSCKKEGDNLDKNPSPDVLYAGEKTELAISIGDASVKSFTGDTPEEAKINDVQILVFREDGILDAYKKAEAPTVSGILCTSGLRNIYAVVNFAEDLSGIKRQEELIAKSFLFKDEKLGGFQMAGKTSLPVFGSAMEIPLTVYRAVAKIHFTGIKTDFEAQAYQGVAFEVNKIYAINVTGSYALSYPETNGPVSINKAGLDPSLSSYSKETLLYEPENPIVINNGEEAVSVDRCFYVYPNFSVSDKDKTRIVIEASLDGKVFYYPLTFGGLIKNNTFYDIKGLVIKRPGSDSPDNPVTVNECGFSVSVSDWTIGEDMSVTI